MKRTLLIVSVVAVLAAAVASPALAAHKGGKGRAAAAHEHAKAAKKAHRDHRKYQFTGVVTESSSGSLSFTMKRGNKPARRWAAAHDGDVTVMLDGTKFSPRSITDGSGINVGDRVTVLAFVDEDDVLVAKRVGVKHHHENAPAPSPEPSESESPAPSPDPSAEAA